MQIYNDGVWHLKMDFPDTEFHAIYEKTISGYQSFKECYLNHISNMMDNVLLESVTWNGEKGE